MNPSLPTKSLEDRRWAILYIAEEDMVVAFEMLFGKKHQYRLQLALPNGLKVRDCRVCGVHHSWERRSFAVKLRHSSFEVVPDGGMPPVLQWDIKWEYVPDDEPTPTIVETPK